MRLVAISAEAVADRDHQPPRVERTAHDPCGGWAQKRQVEPCGALLVRPDGHVAWRCEQVGATTSVDELRCALRAAVEATLALNPSSNVLAAELDA